MTLVCRGPVVIGLARGNPPLGAQPNRFGDLEARHELRDPERSGVANLPDPGRGVGRNGEV